MRQIDRAAAFKRDYKREAKGRHRATLDDNLVPVLNVLATDQPMEPRFRDHDLGGNWAGYRECHVKGLGDIAGRWSWRRRQICRRTPSAVEN